MGIPHREVIVLIKVHLFVNKNHLNFPPNETINCILMSCICNSKIIYFDIIALENHF